ncbi:translation elongation factor EF-1 subunit alpha [Candidatus Woesearchaeota archaeon]|nr:translation elongation factor EF-1 subunit alpha [Candidatus Woesearchaeota archaeon]MCF7901610.1 translation elongation factor EF-1 subunit alpha [Candidatus Woesearchaeota archaeon]MCF8013517.1 translation elongation factor EF-1 subunit alpha [Candidatus Woesearchaeota archaeon]
MAKDKLHMNLVFIGHVDAGKSTTVGRLLFDSGNIDEQAMRKLKDKAAELGKGGFEFAFVMDNLKEERERGVTIDLAHKKFDSEKYFFTIIDAPGHRDFVKNMITGASQADAAVLVVAATDKEVQPQTREHLFLAKTLGVGQMIIAINKMDMEEYSEAAYKRIKDMLSPLLKSVGMNPDNVPFVPVASLKGDNIVKKSENLGWYTGNSLLGSMDALSAPEKPTNLPMRMPIQDVYNITGIGVVPVGKIETGIMKVGQKVIAVPGREGKGVPGEVKSIEMHHEQYKEAQPGDNVGISVRGFGKKDIARGDVIGPADAVPPVVEEFKAQIVVLNHPSVITKGYTPVFHIHTAQIACQFVNIDKKMNPATGEVLEENPDFIKNGDAAIVTLRPVQPVVIETQKDNPKMSRFAIRDSGTTVAAGMCIELKKKA